MDWAGCDLTAEQWSWRNKQDPGYKEFCIPGSGAPLLPFILMPLSMVLVMSFTVTNHFLSTLDLEDIWLSSHPQWISLRISAFSAWLMARCRSTIPFSSNYKNPTGKNKGRSKILNSVVLSLSCHLSSWLHSSGSFSGSAKGHSLGLTCCLLAWPIHSSTHHSTNI